MNGSIQLLSQQDDISSEYAQRLRYLGNILLHLFIYFVMLEFSSVFSQMLPFIIEWAYPFFLVF